MISLDVLLGAVIKKLTKLSNSPLQQIVLIKRYGLTRPIDIRNSSPEISYRQAVAEFMPDFLYTAMGIPAGTHVGRRIDVRWDAPASMLLLAGAVATGLSNRGPSSFASFLPREVMLPAVKLIS
ncbi:hypothetical protein [Pseudomonas putida]|uniref:hypothetical protein n=1 Tax=Pseudomonas putida TaxID=303 RepID=UPI00275C9B1E|nr:hypothetical protein [Pseudomonas putida]MDP9519531.1 hypothetical protein [Pseudomonas putida]